MYQSQGKSWISPRAQDYHQPEHAAAPFRIASMTTPLLTCHYLYHEPCLQPGQPDQPKMGTKTWVQHQISAGLWYQVIHNQIPGPKNHKIALKINKMIKSRQGVILDIATCLRTHETNKYLKNCWFVGHRGSRSFPPLPGLLSPGSGPVTWESPSTTAWPALITPFNYNTDQLDFSVLLRKGREVYSHG